MTIGRSARSWSCSVAGALALMGALGPSAAVASPSGDELGAPRTVLTRAELMSPMSPLAPVDDGAFAMPADAGAPRHHFEGTLELNGAIKHLPEWRVGFVQSGTRLIPTRQGLQITGDPAWNIIVGPGRVWQEPGDMGATRAAFPFTLVERNQNCAHNGAMTFLFDDHQISRVRYQVTQETCRYRKLDMWGQVSATYRREAIPGADALRARMAREVANRTPTRPLETLARDYPEARIDVRAFGRGVTPSDMTAYGVYYRGVHYVAGCATRYGTYAFCDEMRLPSYSTAKSTFASLAAMRLAERDGGQRVKNLKIADLLLGHELGDRWEDVTLENTLDMATGHYLSLADGADESSPFEHAFLSSEPYADKIALAMRTFPYREPPGRRWIYQSHATFIATRAMTSFVGEDLFDFMRRSVYEPAELSQGFMETLRTDNAPDGQPLGYGGLFYNRDDVSKLIRLITDDHGQADGRQVLDPSLLDAALQRTSDHGLPTGTGFVYKNGFWAKHVTPTEFPQYHCSFWVPFMSGYGGITIAMLPNGVTYWYFSDNDEFRWYDALHEAAKLAPVC